MKTDSQLQQDVMAELDWEPAVPAAQIGVEVKDGVVTLAGEVGSYAEKLNAEHPILSSSLNRSPMWQERQSRTPLEIRAVSQSRELSALGTFHATVRPME